MEKRLFQDHKICNHIPSPVHNGGMTTIMEIIILIIIELELCINKSFRLFENLNELKKPFPIGEWLF